MTAQVEKFVPDSDRTDVQNLLPDSLQAAFDIVARFEVLLCSVSVRFVEEGQFRAIDLAVGRQRDFVQQTKRDGIM